MSSDEGSVMVDGVESTNDLPENTEESSQEEDTSTSEESQSTETATETETEESEEGTGGKDGKPALTEKGTKVDPNPMSALNQQLANERRQRADYEQVLTDPDSLVKYAKTMGLSLTKKEAQAIQEDPEITPDKIETVEDLQKFAGQMQKKLDQKVENLDKAAKEEQEYQRVVKLADKIGSELTQVREKYTELRPTLANGSPNPDYDKDLDDAVGQMYEKADFDPKTQMFKGQVSVLEVADLMMKGVGKGKERGSKDAHTEIKDRRSGRTVAGASNSGPDESNMSSSQLIASRMKQAQIARSKQRK